MGESYAGICIPTFLARRIRIVQQDDNSALKLVEGWSSIAVGDGCFGGPHAPHQGGYIIV
jgi:hypothetical protein